MLKRCSINFIVSVNFNITEVPKLWVAHPEGCCWSCPGWGCRLYEGLIYFEKNMGARLYIYIYIDRFIAWLKYFTLPLSRIGTGYQL
jgi:hypothetical protein